MTDATMHERVKGDVTGPVIADPDRLSALRASGLLDTDVEESFDRMTRLAVRIVGVPAAFISLVDEHRDFYKSACGFGEPLASARQITGPTFCHFAILSTTPLVIPDTAGDPRYRDVPTVRTLGVAAYVGVPIVVGGQPIGSFCAIDTRPREWTEDEVQLLAELAASAQREIELRASERAARETTARLTVAMEAARLGAWTHDVGSETRWNTADANRVLGRPAVDAEVRIDDWLAQVHPDDRDAVRAAFARAAEGSDRYNIEYRVRWPDGSEHWACASGMLLRDGNGEPARLVGTLEDITARKHAEALNRATEQRLRASEARFRLVQDASPDGSVLLEPIHDGAGQVRDFRITYANASAHRILLDAPERILGRTLMEAFPESSARVARYAQVLETGEPFLTEAYYTRADVSRGLRITAVRVDGSVHVAFADLTDRLRAEAERERLYLAEREAHAAADAARQEAERANAAKAQFLATMSHELRTPLNAIGGYAQLIELGVHGPVSPGQAESLGRIQRSQKHLLGLITEVLSYAKLEAGAMHYHLADVPALEIVRGVEALVAPQARAKEITLVVDGSGTDLVVRADPEKAQQVVLNLLSNAVKFTGARGRVTVRCAAAPAEAGAVPMVEFCVEDSGRGISAAQLDHVFDAFVQVGRELTSEQAGTGLGLAISRDLARGMGGEIVATSTEGVGSLFVLTLPRA